MNRNADDAIPDELVIDQREPRLELFDTDLTSRDVRPKTIMQALMEAGPADTIGESIEECSAIHLAIEYATKCLTAEDIFLLNAISSEGCTYEELSVRLGVSRSQGWRLHRRSLARLRTLLLNHQPVRDRLGMEPTWNAAAMAELIAIAGYDEGPNEYPEDIAHVTTNIVYFVNRAHECILAGAENLAVRELTQGAVHAVLYLRRIGKWSLVEMHTLLCSKQSDYGHGNILRFGIPGIVVRSSDKAERLKNLTAAVTAHGGVRPANESLKDTFDDVIGYAAIARMLKQETFELTLETPTESSAA